MIIQNIVDDFYRKLVPGKTVLILAGLDVDSICALRSFIQLLQKDYIPFSLKPIRSKHHLFKTISEHKVSTSSPFTLALPSPISHLDLPPYSHFTPSNKYFRANAINLS